MLFTSKQLAAGPFRTFTGCTSGLKNLISEMIPIQELDNAIIAARYTYLFEHSQV